MKKGRIVAILIYTFCIFWRVECFASAEIEAMVRNGIGSAQGFASSEDSGGRIPEFSREKALGESGSLNSLSDEDLKDGGHKKMLAAKENSAEGITRDAMKKKTLDGFEEHELFTKGERVWKDPAAEMERITAASCKARVNEQKNHYRKKITKVKHSDIEIYQESCEKPAGNITCEKTLSVTCDNNSDCGEDRGGIILDSVESGGVWQYSYPNIRFGNKEGHYNYRSVDVCGDNNACVKVVIPARFRIKRVSEIKTFRLKKVAFDDHAMVKVNGQVVYNSLGGHRLDIYRQCGAWDQEVQAGWGLADICMQNHGSNHYREL